MTEAKELGLVCTVVPPALQGRGTSTIPTSTASTRAAADIDMPLGVHGAPGIHLPKIGVDRFDNYIQVHCVSFPFDQMSAMTALVSGGVFDRHPGLRVAFLEAGADGCPGSSSASTEHFESRGDWIAGGWKRPPAEYVAAGNVRVTCEPDEETLPTVVEALGDECVMFASDYPHWDGAWPRATTELREHAEGVLSDRVAGPGGRRQRPRLLRAGRSGAGVSPAPGSNFGVG